MIQKNIKFIFLVSHFLKSIEGIISKSQTLNDLFRELNTDVLDYNYFVQGPKCLIANIEDNEGYIFRKVHRSSLLESCSNQKDLVSVVYDNFLQRYILHINDPVVHELLNSSQRTYHCFYRNIKNGKLPAANDA